MKIWKDRNGKWITLKEFIRRWKAGIKKVKIVKEYNNLEHGILERQGRK